MSIGCSGALRLHMVFCSHPEFAPERDGIGDPDAFNRPLGLHPAVDIDGTALPNESLELLGRLVATFLAQHRLGQRRTVFNYVEFEDGRNPLAG